jgi:FkbM family methyltransferase
VQPLRLRFQPAIWVLLLPVRAFAHAFPSSVVTTALVRGVIQPLMPPAPAEFVAELGPHRRVPLLYSELIGAYVHVYGPGYEEAEAAALRAQARRGSVAIDVGAHAGLITTVLAEAVGPEGQVWSIEPRADTVERLRRALELSGAANVEVHNAAASDAEGELHLTAGRDPAQTQLAPDGAVTVRALTLDGLWASHGEPEVSVVKIDVEGAEPAVLRGALRLLERCHPAVLMEANDSAARQAQEELLRPFGYTRSQPEGFLGFNSLYR